MIVSCPVVPSPRVCLHFLTPPTSLALFLACCAPASASTRSNAPTSVGLVVPAGSSSPLLSPPVAWHMLLHLPRSASSHPRDLRPMAVWSAIPPPGFSSLGMVVAPASSGVDDMAAADNFRCVRNDACQLARFPAQPAYFCSSYRPPFSLWAVGNEVRGREGWSDGWREGGWKMRLAAHVALAVQKRVPPWS